MTSQEERQQQDPEERDPEEGQRREGDDDRQDGEQSERRDGEGAGPAEDLEKDPAYSPQGPEGKYKGG